MSWSSCRAPSFLGNRPTATGTWDQVSALRVGAVRQPVYVFRDVARARVGLNAFFCEISNPTSFRLYLPTRISTIVFVPRRDPKACASHTAAGVCETEPPSENIPLLGCSVAARAWGMREPECQRRSLRTQVLDAYFSRRSCRGRR
eukprot:2819260-Prymnesium_polylepis.1